MVDDAKLHHSSDKCSPISAARRVLHWYGSVMRWASTRLCTRGPMTVDELAAAAGVNERYLREWLSHQAASNYLAVLGAQAGDARLRLVGGFRSVRRAAETPFNMILEARP